MSLVTPQSSVVAKDDLSPTESGDPARVEADALELRIHRLGSPDRRLSIRVDRCTLGSGEGCTVRLADPAICELHAVLLSAAGRVLIRGYSIPLEINGQFTIEAFLKPGDVFHLGSYRFEILSLPTHAQPPTALEPDTADAEPTIRAQWLRMQQRLEALTLRHQEALESLEQAREEAHQARRRIEALQRECRDRADLQAHQAQAHAEELQSHADQVSQLQLEVLRLRAEIDQYRIRIEQSEREQERGAAREKRLLAATESHEADRAQWKHRMAELTEEVQRLQTERDARTVPTQSTVRAVIDDPLPGEGMPTESVEARMSFLLARIGKLTDESLDLNPAGGAEPNAHAATLANAMNRSDAPTEPDVLTEPATLTGQGALTGPERVRRLRSEPILDRKPAAAPMSSTTGPPEQYAWPAAPVLTTIPALSLRPRLDRWQYFVVPILAVLFFVLGNRDDELSLVWNTAGGLTCSLMVFFAYDIWREHSIARWATAANAQRHRSAA